MPKFDEKNEVWFCPPCREEYDQTVSDHITAITYEPKIKKVLDLDVRRTMRKTRKFKSGQHVLIHGWSGRPYRSKWSWRMKVHLITVLNFHLSKECISIMDDDWKVADMISWSSETANGMAFLDGVEGGGEGLKKSLKKLNGRNWQGSYQMIVWGPIVKRWSITRL